MGLTDSQASAIYRHMGVWKYGLGLTGKVNVPHLLSMFLVGSYLAYFFKNLFVLLIPTGYSIT